MNKNYHKIDWSKFNKEKQTWIQKPPYNVAEHEFNPISCKFDVKKIYSQVK